MLLDYFRTLRSTFELYFTFQIIPTVWLDVYLVSVSVAIPQLCDIKLPKL